MSDSGGIGAALVGATVRTFPVPGVGRVRVEIGDEVPGNPWAVNNRTGHTFPAYRVSIDEAPVMDGTDWGVPQHMATDGMAAALDLVQWTADHSDNEELALWVGDRRALRDALSAPGAGHWRETVDAWRAERY